MVILAFDTSTKTASVALLQNEVLIVEQIINTRKNHGETLLSAIESILAVAGMQIDDIELVAVTIGPGSFTGLRVGAGTAKGLAFSKGIPIVGVSTLDAMAANAPSKKITICPMLDARKNEVYTAFYRMNRTGFPVRITDERVISPELLLADIDEDILYLGDGALAYGNLIRSKMHNKAHFVPAPLNYIRASSVGLIGLKKFHDGDTLNSLMLTPRYVRLSEAETKGRAIKEGPST